MKYTYFGFSQAKAVEMNLDIIDLAILRYFIDFKDSGAMVTKTIEGQTYYWVKYDAIIENNPIYKINSKRVVARRLDNMVSAGVLTKYLLKKGGNYTLFGIGPKYIELIRSDVLKSTTLCTQKYNPMYSKVQTKDSSIKDSSIKDIKDNSQAKARQEISYKDIIEYLNSKADRKFNHNSNSNRKLIKARYNEGYKKEDFIKVIDTKVKEWKNTDMERYIRPVTLFGNKFDDYLNQDKINKDKTDPYAGWY